MSRKPIYSARSKGIDVAVWEGNTGAQYTIRKSYKDKQTEQWKESKTFFSNDLQILQELIREALAHGGTVDSSVDASNGVKEDERDYVKEKFQKPDFNDDDIPF